ncbi:MAG TPA: glutamate-cysteine ligase family protein, partial [Actinomycetota bacterium]|nr:glutamate-cysteine ligase family protein [Actinomycetota bacterium]
WLSMDPRRTHPALRTGGPTADWTQYALDAQVMLIRLDDSRYEAITETTSFRDWIDNGHAYGFPTEDDFAYHLTTLFPPVRPRGRLEIRMIDALPDDLLRVATATVCSLLGPQGVDEISKRSWNAGSLWYEAARYGLSHPELRRIVTESFEIALDVAEDSGVDANTRSMMATYFSDHISVGRCPADDRLDRFDRAGEVLPEISREPAWS